jgi:ribosomal protein RSM22 (predicted rRNA methylase)
MSDASVSFRYFEIPPNKPAPSVLSWRWKVDSHSSLAPQTVKGKDDRPLAIHVWFDKAGADTVLSGLTARVGKPKVGKLLSYVWGAQEPAGSVLENPYYRKGRVIVLVGEDGQIGEWATVQRDIVADYRRAFGAEPDMSRLRYIAISADTDDLNGQSSASVRELAFGLR